MRDSQDSDGRFICRVNNGKWKTPKKDAPGAEHPNGPALRRVVDHPDSATNLTQKFLGSLRAAIQVPGNCRPDITLCTFVELDAATAHLPRPEAHDAAPPKEPLLLCPPLGLPSGELSLPPRPSPLTQDLCRDYQAAYWRELLAPLPGERALVSKALMLLPSCADSNSE